LIEVVPPPWACTLTTAGHVADGVVKDVGDRADIGGT
jgi:hypothetical protein